MDHGYTAAGVGACVLGVLTCISGTALAASRTWDGSASTSWNTAANWSGNAVPGNGDTASIGNAPNNNVLLNANAFSGIDDLFLSGGATLNTNGFRLLVDDLGVSSTVIGNGSSLLVPAVAANAALNGFDGDTLTVQSGGTFAPLSRSIIDDRLNVNTGGTLAGGGLLTIGDGSAGSNTIGLNNNGTINASFLGASTLHIVAANNKMIDLDGTSGNGVVLATGDAFLGGIAAAHLTIDGELSDAFSGTMEIGRRDTITMTDPWTLNGRIEFRGADSFTDAAFLESAGMTIAAGADIEVTQGVAQIEASFGMGGGTFTMNNDTTVWFRQNAAFGPAGILDLAAANVAVNIRADVGLQQPTVDLDGTAGNNHIRLVGVNHDTTPSLRIDGDFTDAFNGSLSLEHNSTLTLNGNATFASNSSFHKIDSNIRLNIGGTTTILTDIDLDGFFGDTVVDITNDSASLTLGGSINLGGFNNDFRGTLINRGTFTVTGGSYLLSNGGTIELRDVGADPTLAGDLLSNNGGIIFGNGRITADVNNNADGRVRPGNHLTAGRLRWESSTLDLRNNSVAEIDLGGTTPGLTHDRIDATTLELQGATLDLNLFNSYLPALYLPHAVIETTNPITGFGGVFGDIQGMFIVGTGTALAVTYTDTQVLVQRAIYGDANLNGQVEQADLDAVLLNWGNSWTDGASWTTGDLNGNGQVEQGDLDFVLLNWGNTAAPGLGSQPVPEPTTAISLLLLTLLPAQRPRRPESTPPTAA